MVGGEAVPVDVWLVPPAEPGGHGADARAALLGDDERARADRFRRPEDRATYVAAHAALRRLAGARLGVAPAAVRLGREDCPLCGGPHGRPILLDTAPGDTRARDTRAAPPATARDARAAPPASRARDTRARDDDRGRPPGGALADSPGGDADGTTPGARLEFSLSRTRSLAAVALSPAVVGVDVEVAGRDVSLDDLLVALHPGERPVADRAAALRLWVRKEAYLKGLGTGLGLDPATVDLSVDPPGWQVLDVPAGPGAVCAVAVRTTAPVVLTVGEGTRPPAGAPLPRGQATACTSASAPSTSSANWVRYSSA